MTGGNNYFVCVALTAGVRQLVVVFLIYQILRLKIEEIVEN